MKSHSGSCGSCATYTRPHSGTPPAFFFLTSRVVETPLGIFSGDFLLIGFLGRPIFSAKAKSNVWLNSCLTVRNIASRICQTARSYTRVMGLVPLGVGISERPESTIGYERHCNVFMASSSRESFVAKIFGSVPQFPEYYRKMKALNAKGAPPFSTLPGGVAHNPSSFEAESRKEGGIILDVRTHRDAFGGAQGTRGRGGQPFT